MNTGPVRQGNGSGDDTTGSSTRSRGGPLRRLQRSTPDTYRYKYVGSCFRGAYEDVVWETPEQAVSWMTSMQPATPWEQVRAGNIKPIDFIRTYELEGSSTSISNDQLQCKDQHAQYVNVAPEGGGTHLVHVRTLLANTRNRLVVKLAPGRHRTTQTVGWGVMTTVDKVGDDVIQSNDVIVVIDNHCEVLHSEDVTVTTTRTSTSVRLYEIHDIVVHAHYERGVTYNHGSKETNGRQKSNARKMSQLFENVDSAMFEHTTVTATPLYICKSIEGEVDVSGVTGSSKLCLPLAHDHLGGNIVIDASAEYPPWKAGSAKAMVHLPLRNYRMGVSLFKVEVLRQGDSTVHDLKKNASQYRIPISEHLALDEVLTPL